jgi:hypothetical protein
MKKRYEIMVSHDEIISTQKHDSEPLSYARLGSQVKTSKCKIYWLLKSYEGFQKTLQDFCEICRKLIHNMKWHIKQKIFLQEK